MTYLRDLIDLTLYGNFAKKYPVYQELLTALEQMGVMESKSVIVPRLDTKRKLLLADSPPILTYEIVSFMTSTDSNRARDLIKKLKKAELHFDDGSPEYIAIHCSWDHIEGTKSKIFVHIE